MVDNEKIKNDSNNTIGVEYKENMYKGMGLDQTEVVRRLHLINIIFECDKLWISINN